MDTKKFISLENLGLYDEKIKKHIGDADAATLQSAKDYADGEVNKVKEYIGTIPETATATDVVGYIQEKTAGIATDTALEELTGRVTQAETDIDNIEKDYVKAEEGKSLVSDTEIEKLAGVSEGANKVEKSDTNGNIKVDGTDVVVYTHPEKHAIADVDGLQDALNAKVVSVTAGDNSVTIGGTDTAPTVAVKLSADADNALKLTDEGGLKVTIPTAAEYSIVKAADSGEYAAVYNLTKDGAVVGASINIPKDLVVKSGSVVGNEIILVLNDDTNTEIKIPVGSLIEYVTSGSATGDMVVVNVSDDHKVTATITDGTITLAKLDVDTQTKINKAHTHENADVLAGITATKVNTWDNAQANAEAKAAELDSALKTEIIGSSTDASTANTINGAKKYTDEAFAAIVECTTDDINALFA